MSTSIPLPRPIAATAAAGSASSVMTPLFVAIASVLAALYASVGSFALMIILLGAAVTLLSTPLTAAMWRSQVALARVAPKLAELRRQHADDRQRLAAETSELFKQHGISPWAGCLPGLLSGPIYFSIYRVVRGLTNKPAGSLYFQPRYLAHSSRLFQTLASSTAMNCWGVNLANTGFAAIQLSAASAGLFLAVVAVAAAAGIWQQHLIKAALSQPDAPTPSRANKLTQLLPAVFAQSALFLPLAVSLYYATAGVVRLGQQWALVRFHPL